MLNDSPQSKLNQQVQQGNKDQQMSSMQSDVNTHQSSRPIDSTPGQPERPDPKMDSLPDNASSTIKDNDGKDRQLPEQEESGFKAKLKQKLMDTMMEKMTSSEGAPRADGDLKSQKLEGKQDPKPTLGSETPQPARPKPHQPQPEPPQPQTPKIQVPRMRVPKIGGWPRF